MALKSVITIFTIIYIISAQKGTKGGGGGKGGKSNKNDNKDTDTNTTSTETQPLLSLLSAATDLGIDIGCHRHRKPWHEIDDIQRELYISGFKQLSENGRLSSFVNQHASDGSSPQAHSTAAFLPWHRYFLWEVETAFRSLGDEYECFAIPYWYVV